MMPVAQITALTAFIFVMSFTPGPNNFMLLASGVNFGWMRTLPHMAGVTVGFALMIVLVGLGFSQIFERFPDLYLVLKWCSVAYLLWIAWTLFSTSGMMKREKSGGGPMSFVQAAAFQWVNPKAWTVALATISTYTLPNDYLVSLAIIGITSVLVSVPSTSIWALGGVWVQRYLSTPVHLRLFNIAMAVLLIASLIPTLIGH